MCKLEDENCEKICFCDKDNKEYNKYLWAKWDLIEALELLK